MQSSSASVDDFLHIFTSKQKQLDLSNLQNNFNQKNFKQEVQGLQAFLLFCRNC